MDNNLILCYGEILWDLLPAGKQIGGAPFNVACHLNKLGLKVKLISKIGADRLGDEILKTLQKNNFSRELIQQSRTLPTSIVRTTIDKTDEVAYEIVKGVAWDCIVYNENIAQHIQNAQYLVFGSLAMRCETTRNTLFKMLKENLAVKKVLDVNLRPPFYTRERIKQLLTVADIVKMNEAELRLISNWLGEQGTEKEKIRFLAKKFSLEILIVTMGGKGAYLWKGHHCFFAAGEKIRVTDTVGSGDAFLAGFLTEYINGKAPAEALHFANKMGAFIAQKKGGCPPYYPEEIRQ